MSPIAGRSCRIYEFRCCGALPSGHVRTPASQRGETAQNKKTEFLPLLWGWETWTGIEKIRLLRFGHFGRLLNTPFTQAYRHVGWHSSFHLQHLVWVAGNKQQWHTAQREQETRERERERDKPQKFVTNQLALSNREIAREREREERETHTHTQSHNPHTRKQNGEVKKQHKTCFPRPHVQNW